MPLLLANSVKTHLTKGRLLSVLFLILISYGLRLPPWQCFAFLTVEFRVSRQLPKEDVSAWPLHRLLFMTKPNQIFALSGMVIGIILGAVIANQPSPREKAIQAAAQKETPKAAPANDSTIQKRIAEQQRILKTDSKNQEAIVAMANLNYDAKNYGEAVQWYEKALLKDPSNTNLLTDLGTSYLQLKQFEKAFESYRKSLAIDPMDRQTLMNFGVARLASGDREGAADLWEKVIQLYPSDPHIEELRNAVEQIRQRQGG